MDNISERYTVQRSFAQSTDEMYYNLTDKEVMANINSKMQVPNRLSLDGRPLGGSLVDPRSGASLDMPITMAVPERILVAGSDTHISAKESVFTSDYDMVPTPGDLQKEASRLVELATPPRVLTVEQQMAAMAERHEAEVPPVKPPPLDFEEGTDAYISQRTNWKQVETVAAGKPSRTSTDSADLESVVSQLSRRLAVVEEENRQRHNRELILYPALAVYVVIKVIRWLISR